MFKCTINGQELLVKEGTSIIQAMHENGIKVAHFCWHPALSVAGVCRLCMVEVKGNPRLQLACNTQVTQGMIINNNSQKVKDAVKWGMDFHLINHPLDCPICDQSGECGLQDQYMEYGKYDPEMAEQKTRKKKVIDLGPTVVLDAERCVLCSRCVRFTDEVTKTKELGIFNRGDRSEIGTFNGKKLENKYSMNVIDICPVGALTSKDFRFRQRVWFLKQASTICNGCSTGCSVQVFFNKEGLFRVKPNYNPQVNNYWMCDEGRNIYKFINKENRLLKARKLMSPEADGSGSSDKSDQLDKADKSDKANSFFDISPGAAAKEAAIKLAELKGHEMGVVLTGQYTTEEYGLLLETFVNQLNCSNIFHWINNEKTFDDYDGLLLRGDKNPNTKGLVRSLEKFKISSSWSDLVNQLERKHLKALIVVGPENLSAYPDFQEKIRLFSKAPFLILMQSSFHPSLDQIKTFGWLIPMKSYIEKEGSFLNHQGLEQKVNKVTTVVSEALTLSEAVMLFAGKKVIIKTDSSNTFVESSRPEDRVTVESRVKNEFIFKRGPL